MTYTKTAVLRPAYYRKYKSAQDMMKAWHNGANFILLFSGYYSVHDVKQLEADYDKIVLVNAHGNMERVELQFGPSILK